MPKTPIINLIAKHPMAGTTFITDMSPLINIIHCINDFKKNRLIRKSGA
jgi:hypothetical protein